MSLSRREKDHEARRPSDKRHRADDESVRRIDEVLRAVPKQADHPPPAPPPRAAPPGEPERLAPPQESAAEARAETQPASSEMAEREAAAEQRIPPLLPGQIDIVVGPLPFADDRHRFENAIRRLPGVRETTALYARGGVYRIRVTHRGGGRLSEQIRALRVFKTRVIAESRTLIQVLVEPEGRDLA